MSSQRVRHTLNDWFQEGGELRGQSLFFGLNNVDLGRKYIRVEKVYT